ncbi:MAG TPA: hypothetical protein PKI33_09445, partial [Anaerolineales bacterium]|nr:hypothetical protein [Anaerolineales bacterium]
MESVSTRKFLQVWLWALAVVSLCAILQTIQRTTELEIVLLRSKWIGLVGIFAFTAILSVWISFSSFLNHIVSWFDDLENQSLSPLIITFYIALIIFGFLVSIFFRLYIFSNTLPQVMPILWIFLWASLA